MTFPLIFRPMKTFDGVRNTISIKINVKSNISKVEGN